MFLLLLCLFALGLLVLRRAEGNLVTKIAYVNSGLLAGLALLAHFHPGMVAAIAQIWQQTLTPVWQFALVLVLVPAIYAVTSLVHERA